MFWRADKAGSGGVGGKWAAMIVFLNGDYLEERVARVPVTDRGFLFGDGVFETLRVAEGRLLLWREHVSRLRRGAETLAIPLAPTDALLQGMVQGVLKRNELRDAVVRMTLTRGSGPRGYSPRGADSPTLLITAQPAPEPFGGATDGWDLMVSQQVLPTGNRLSTIKHANRLQAILARSEADAAGVQEALLLNTEGHIAEASGANIAWFEGATLVTPAEATGALPGVLLKFVVEEAGRLGWACRTAQVRPEQLWTAEGVFLTNSVQLLVPVRSLNGRSLRGGEKVKELAAFLRFQLLGGGSACA